MRGRLAAGWAKRASVVITGGLLACGLLGAKKVAATPDSVRTSSAAHLKYCRLTGTTRRFS
jgi:hypothetical protein